MVQVKVSHLPKMDLTSVGQAVTVCEQAQLADEDHSECNVIMWAMVRLFLSNTQSIMQFLLKCSELQAVASGSRRVYYAKYVVRLLS